MKLYDPLEPLPFAAVCMYDVCLDVAVIAAIVPKTACNNNKNMVLVLASFH